MEDVMSHFLVLVFGDDYNKQLAPYSEEIEVDPYQETCYCVGTPMQGDPSCGCRGGQLLTSTYNPKSKWDWYSIGGRWLGFLPLKPNKEATMKGEPGAFGNDPINGGRGADQARKEDVDWDRIEYSPMAFVKNGEWKQKGQMGWFGVSSNNKTDEDWEAEWKAGLKGVPEDQLVTVIDCHI